MPFDQPFSRSFAADAIREHAPALSGVYGLSNATEWIYIGETDNIQHALLQHLYEVTSPARNHRPTGFVFEACDRAKRPGRQDRLVLEYEPACNRRGR